MKWHARWKLDKPIDFLLVCTTSAPSSWQVSSHCSIRDCSLWKTQEGNPAAAIQDRQWWNHSLVNHPQGHYYLSHDLQNDIAYWNHYILRYDNDNNNDNYNDNDIFIIYIVKLHCITLKRYIHCKVTLYYSIEIFTQSWRTYQSV